jgi:serine/threonine protein kinase
MSATPDPIEAETEDDPRLVRAAQEYLAALESGRRPTRSEFVARYPDLAEQLAPYLDALDMVHASGPSVPRPLAKPAAEQPLPVEALGDFHIVREIGRGGMGVVYEAVQLSLGRRVALKVLPFAAALDNKQLQRFRNEAQAAAQLHHTNIVPVYAVGCERGTHYYAMQLIEGQNLADLIQQLRPAEREPKRRPPVHETPTKSLREAKAEASNGAVCSAEPEAAMPAKAPAPLTVGGPAAELSTHYSARSARFFRTAARLAVQAADALEHAHELGVVHRDIKPANLIVDERGNVWVTDFGLAQFNADAGLTQTGALLGTLRYMSPEQAGGKGAVLDHRTDVYSLGATLYELLTLRPIFEGNDRQTLLCQIAADDPRPPRSIDRSIPAELETIVLKAVSKNPAERYDTAKDFGDDLRRFLDNRPILARPPTLAQRVRKWGRRHPSVVVAAVVLLALTAAGSVLGAFLIHQEQEKTLARAKQAEAALKLARQSADEMFQISEEELAGKPFTEELRKRMLMSALGYYQGLIAQSGDDAEAQADLAVNQQKVNQILADLAVLQGGGRVDLLYRDDVRKDKDLGLTGDERAKVNGLLLEFAPKKPDGVPDFLRLTPDQRLAQARTKEAKLENILNAQQLERLKQIALQLKGSSAFHDPEVEQDLNLTPDQKKALRTIEADAFWNRGPADAGKGPAPFLQSPTDRFLTILTDDQKQKWKLMTGNTFMADAPPPFPQHPPRQGPGRDAPGRDGPARPQPPGPPG